MSTANSPLLADPQQEPMVEQQQMNDPENAAGSGQPSESGTTAKSGSSAKTSIVSLCVILFLLGICALLSWATDTWWECLVSWAVNLASFLFIAWPFKTEKYYDFTGMVMFLSLDFFSMFFRQVPWTVDNIRNIILFFMTMVWTLRLGIFLFRRISGSHGGKDKRFDNARNNFLLFAVFWSLQAIWGYFCMMPLLVVNQIGNERVRKLDAPAVTVWDGIGWFLWVFGWGFEILADRQKSAFKADQSNRGKFCNVGLWAWSRHPNYFGEIVLWTGIFVCSASVAQDFGWFNVLSPLYTILLLVFVSGVPLAERTSMKKYGSQPEYQEYVETVSVLVPLPCCWKCYT